MATDPVSPRRLAVAACVAAACATFAGCAVGPEPVPPHGDVPAAWSPSARSAKDGALASRVVERPFDGRRWWTVFGDPVLDRLIDAGRAQNLDVEQAALRIAAARVRRDAAAGAAYPNVAESTLAGRSRMSENGVAQALAGSGAPAGGATGAPAAPTTATASSPSTFNLFQAGFDATWELDLFGKTRRNVQAAAFDVESAEAQRRDAQVSLSAEIARAYFALRSAERQRAIADADLATQERMQQLVASRNRAGLSPSSDVVAQRSEVAAARAQLQPLAQRIAESRNRLALLLALPPGGVDAWLTASARPLAALPPEVPIGLPGELLRRRPDIRRSEADLQAATARVGVATAALFPSIRFGVTGGLQSTEASSLLDWASRFALGGVQISLPVFDGGRIRSQVRLADTQAQIAALAYRQAVLSAFHDVDNAMAAYATEQRRAVDLQAQLDAAVRSRRLAESRYASGLAPYLDVLDADRRAHEAETGVAESSANASIDLVALFKALGGGWSDDETAASARP